MRLQFSALLVSAVLATTSGIHAETVTRTGTNGDPGVSTGSPGEGGGNGESGQGLIDSVNSPVDANKTLELFAGNGGSGGAGGADSENTGGKGGNGGNGGSATGSSTINADFPTQILSMTVRGGNGGFGTGGASSAGAGGNSGSPGDASATATLTAGPSTTTQQATFDVDGGSAGPAGAGQIDAIAKRGGTAGRSRQGGEAFTRLTMVGGATTITQQVTINSSAGSSGTHGLGAGVPLSLNSDPSHPIGSEIDLDLFTPANGAVVTVNASSFGGTGVGRPDTVSGGPLPSRGKIRASRIEASGAGSTINATLRADGGNCLAYAAPDLGIQVRVPADFSSVAKGASPLVEPLDLIAGPGGNITGSLTMFAGNGGGTGGFSPPRAGNGGTVDVDSPRLRAVSDGGNITLTLNGGGGIGGTGPSRNGIGGHVSLFNGLSADTPSGNVTLTQTATGGTRGGRAVSSLNTEGTTNGNLAVNATATGGQVSSGSAPNSSLGSGEATVIARGVGARTEANATANGNTATTTTFGARATAQADATGPTNVTAIAAARAGRGSTHGTSIATSVARATTPGTVVSARATTNGDFGQQDATAISEGHTSLPVSWIASTYSADRISRGFLDASNTAQAGADVPNGSFAFFSTRNASFNDLDANQLQQAVTTPLGANPVPAAFFNGLANEKHLISCRFVRDVASLEFPAGKTTTHTHGGAFRLRAGTSGGQLVLSGLGFNSAGGGFDSGVFRFFKDGIATTEIPFRDVAEAALIFSNQTTVLADLSLANDGTVFSWEAQFTNSTASQGFNGDFLLSATTDSGLAVAPPSPPSVPILDRLEINFDFSDVFTPAHRLNGVIIGAAAFANLGVEASTDLGRTDPWTTINTFTTDALGRAPFSDLRHPTKPDAPNMFFRTRRE